MLFYIFLVIIFIIIVYAFIVYNTFVKLNNKVDEAFSTMDVYLKKRWDLIPNLVEVVKGYTTHEKNTLKEVIDLRNNTYDNLTSEEKIETNERLNQELNKIMLLKESYPELKASDSFNKLTNELVNIEEDIANSRKYYNGIVRMFNNKVEMFPSNIFAKLFGYKTKLMFEAKKSERKNIKVDL
mgnify:FL=1